MDPGDLIVSQNGWRRPQTSHSLPEVFSTINVPKSGSFRKNFWLLRNY